MPNIVSQTQVDSPTFSSPFEEYVENEAKILDDSLTVPEVSLNLAEDRSSFAEMPVDKGSSPRSYPLWTGHAKKDTKKLYVAETPEWVLSKPSDWIASSAKKKRKIGGKGCAQIGVADDPASILLAKKLRHEYLMELHDFFKKGRKDASTVLVTKTKNKSSTHGLAPRGLSIPAQGNAYVVGGSNAAKEPLIESTLERHNRFEEEEETARKKKEKKEVRNLKKDGKVCTLAPYMYS